MAISMYHASVPVFLQLLGGLKGTLDKAQKHATEKKWDEATTLNWRLYPDMFTLARQVRQVCVHALGAGTVAGVTPPQLPDLDNSWAEMQSRLDKTVDFLKGLRADQTRRQGRFDGHDHRRRAAAPIQGAGLPLPFRNAELLFPHHDCLQHPALARDRDRQARFYGSDAVVTVRLWWQRCDQRS